MVSASQSPLLCWFEDETKTDANFLSPMWHAPSCVISAIRPECIENGTSVGVRSNLTGAYLTRGLTDDHEDEADQVGEHADEAEDVQPRLESRQVRVADNMHLLNQEQVDEDLGQRVEH